MQTLVEWLSNLNLESLKQIDRYYHSNCEFKDPFNHVFSRDKIHYLFCEMFELDDAKFELIDHIQQENKLFITWNLYFSFRGKPQSIHGSSYILVGEDGLVTSHLDYWDAAEQVYEKIPILGWVLRKIKKRFS